MSETPNSEARPNEVVEILKTIAAALLIALVLRVVFFQPYTIPSSSMEPVLRTGDYIVVSKFRHGWSRASVPFDPPLPAGRLFFRNPRRGDIIVFRLPRHPAEVLVKRLVGLPGDRIQVIRSRLYVNGEALPTETLGATLDPEAEGRRVMQVRETMSSGRRYITYDEDAAHDGDDTDVYVVPEGQYFFMGDNRDNSLDSRWPKAVGVGFVPAENLIGRADLVLLSWQPGASILKPWTWLKLRPSRFFQRI